MALNALEKRLWSCFPQEEGRSGPETWKMPSPPANISAPISTCTRKAQRVQKASLAQQGHRNVISLSPKGFESWGNLRRLACQLTPSVFDFLHLGNASR